MDDRVETLRAELEAARGGQSRWRCPAALRERVIAFARREIGVRGRTLQAVASELGLSQSGLGRWLRRERSSDLLRGRFRPVQVVAASGVSAGSLILVTPSGYRVEGLSVTELAALLPRL